RPCDLRAAADEAHRMTVLAKNIMDSCASAIAFWIFNEVGQPSIVRVDGVTQPHLLLWHWAFCAASVTICSGAMAERTHMTAYLTFAACMAGVVYPTVADSAWGSGRFAGEFHGRPPPEPVGRPSSVAVVVVVVVA
ncbi:unnamed protein product, partial [Prorocentrum cordatum]